MAKERKGSRRLPPPPAPKRISARTREAVKLIAFESLTQRKAAQIVGMSEQALSKALRQDHVKALLNEQKALFTREIDDLKGTAKRLAIRTGIELMGEGQPASVRARMVEFFGGEPKAGPSVAVQVNVDRGGYEYLPQGAKLVEIEAPTITQPTDNIADAELVPDAESGAADAESPDE